MKTPTVVAALLLVALSSCGDDRAASPVAPPPQPSPGATPVEEGVEAPTATQACANGWLDPTDPEQRELPFHVIRRTMKVDGEFDVTEMRYLEGPE